MTSRTYNVCSDGDNYRIQVRTKYAKASKRSLFERRGYPCANTASNDVTRLINFFSEGHKKIIDFVSCYTDVSNCRNQAVKLDYSRAMEKVRGCAKSGKRTNLQKEYNSYKKILKSWGEVCIPQKEWIEQHNQKAFDKDRFMRRYYRDPKVLQAAITKGLLSQSDSEVTESFKASINYFRDRIKTLEGLISQNKACLKLLRSAIFSGSTFTLLLKAKFDHEVQDDETINLVEDEPFTLQNVSKAQLTRSIQQCQLVEKVYNQVSSKLSDEFSLISEVVKDIEDPRLSMVASKQNIQQHWNKIKEHKIIYSIGQIVSNVSNETDGIVSTKVILKWYHEFQEFRHFKEDMRGCHLRHFLLDEYSLKRPFELYLKNEKHLTVDVARIQLESLIRAHAAKHPSDANDLVDKMLPLHNRSVHRWMLMCGCKYEKATVSYYTDSHEAESTKLDFKTR